MKRVLGVFALLVSLMGLLGCGESGLLDFFESGFADDDNGNNDNGGGDGELTAEALAGEWGLNHQASTTVLLGTWNVVDTVDTAFLPSLIQNPEAIEQLVISERTFEFRDSDNVILDNSLNFQILPDDQSNQIRLTSGSISQDIEATLATRLTLNDGTSEAVFEVDDTNPVITECDLQITSDKFISTITRSDGESETITEDFVINGSTISLTEDSASTNVSATLSNGDNTLELRFLESDPHRRGIAVFER